ncbi:MAG TPA: DUF4290 domain-containing protein [Bacteroidia bacterium]|nr:DUF4290 domain-containing protein [Bacteroidia bacterium]
MEYNSGRNRLIIPEYGRNIQKLIEYAITLEDREERNKIAQAIVTVMGQLNPHLRDITDFKHKLWDHLFIISDFKLDVDSPYDRPTALTYKVKPKGIAYPTSDIRFRHYGRIIEQMIKEIKDLEETPEKEQMVINIANFMKMLYVNWNKDSVSDEVIFEHLRILSKGSLTVKPETRLEQPTDLPSKVVTKKAPIRQQRSRARMPNNGNGKNFRKG